MGQDRKEVLLDANALDIYLEYWVIKLNLQHWDIEAKISDIRELGEGKIGRNRYDWQALESRIELIHPEHYEDWKPYDMEFILVHELLHLIIDVQYPIVKGRREIFSEQAINQVARTMIDLDRENVKARENLVFPSQAEPNPFEFPDWGEPRGKKKKKKKRKEI